MAGTAGIQAEKARWRGEALARRDALPLAERAAAAQTIAVRPFPLAIAPGAVVSGYAPINSELDPLPLMRRLEAGGAGLALPDFAERGQALRFRAWRFGAPLVTGAWQIRAPEAQAPEAEPDILLVPLAAFDRKGRRIGYGGGFFDRTLQKLRLAKRITAVGLAFAAQEISQVPVTERDACLDLVLTERDVIDCRGA